MRLHRFFIEENIGNEKTIKMFDEALLHQMKNVFRLEAGKRVIFFDGTGNDYECEIKILAKKEGEFEVVETKESFMPEKKVSLYLSIIKKDNFELASRQATELGVSEIIPVLTERSEKKNIDLERVRRIVKEASEQSGRGNVPITAGVTNLELAITNANGEILVADFGGIEIKDLKLETFNLQLFVGPEGGWSEVERDFFKNKNVKFISLGPTVLRAETAVVSALTLILSK